MKIYSVIGLIYFQLNYYHIFFQIVLGEASWAGHVGSAFGDLALTASLRLGSRVLGHGKRLILNEGKKKGAVFCEEWLSHQIVGA